MSKGNFNNAKTTITLHPPNSTYLASWSKWSTKVNFPPFLPSQTYSMIHFVLVFASADNLSSLSNFLFLYELTYPSSISLNPSSSVSQHGCQFSSAGALAGREVRSSSRDLPSRERERGGASGCVCVCVAGGGVWWVCMFHLSTQWTEVHWGLAITLKACFTWSHQTHEVSRKKART